MPELITQLLKEDNIPGFALLAIVTDKYGPDCYQMQPELLKKDIEDDFGVELSDLQSDKLQAAIIVLATNMYEQQWETFAVISHVLSGVHEQFETIDPDDVEAEEVIRALAEITIIKNAEYEPLEFDDEVRAFAGLIFQKYGFSKAPKLFVSAIMPTPVKECDDTEKNEALQEMWDESVKLINQWAERIKRIYGEN